MGNQFLISTIDATWQQVIQASKGTLLKIHVPREEIILEKKNHFSRYNIHEVYFIFEFLDFICTPTFECVTPEGLNTVNSICYYQNVV